MASLEYVIIIKGSRCFFWARKLTVIILSTGWFQERIRECFYNRTK